MTLNTAIYVHGPIDHHEVFDKVNEILGIPETRRVEEGPARWHGTGLYEISNRPNQGFDAWVMSYSDQLGAEITNQCTTGVCDPQGCDDHDATIPPHHVEVHLDTAYAGTSQDGLDCSTLHAKVITQLHGWLAERGLSLHWRNEYTGEIHEGLTGLVGFIGDGDQAQAWFQQQALPAMRQMLFNPNA